jgi:ATP-dependent DNA helicase RecG
MFDDRIELRSPGLPPEPVTVEALNRRERLHLSRNPLIVRLLAELGYMREVGEGVQRMFAEMEREGFYPPNFADIGNVFFEVTLRNQPVYDPATLEWLRQFDSFDLTGDQKRLLALARVRGGSFTSRDYQILVGLDPYRASNSIKALVRRGLVQSISKGSRVYQLANPRLLSEAPPEELARVLDGLGSEETVTNRRVREVLLVSRPTAARYLQEWVETNWLQPLGSGRATRYRPGVRLNVSASNSP